MPTEIAKQPQKERQAETNEKNTLIRRIEQKLATRSLPFMPPLDALEREPLEKLIQFARGIGA
jgi:hypothetical protein